MPLPYASASDIGSGACGVVIFLQKFNKSADSMNENDINVKYNSSIAAIFLYPRPSDEAEKETHRVGIFIQNKLPLQLISP
jgi:hypothetical protein